MYCVVEQLFYFKEPILVRFDYDFEMMIQMMMMTVMLIDDEVLIVDG